MPFQRLAWMGPQAAAVRQQEPFFPGASGF